MEEEGGDHQNLIGDVNEKTVDFVLVWDEKLSDPLWSQHKYVYFIL